MEDKDATDVTLVVSDLSRLACGRRQPRLRVAAAKTRGILMRPFWIVILPVVAVVCFGMAIQADGDPPPAGLQESAQEKQARLRGQPLSY